MQTLALVAGGPLEELPDLNAFNNEETKWIGIDKGLLYIINAGIDPYHAFGDFDSISDSEKENLKKLSPQLSIFSAEKDKTDTELALDWAVQQQEYSKIILFGATGGRIDHMLGNIQLLIKYKNINKTIEVIDRQNQMRLYQPGTYEMKKLADKKYISFLPVSEKVKGITLKGFKYPLTSCQIELGSTLCISNELIHQAGTFSFLDGILLGIRSKD
ncbi:thiamine diphosphokinase [Metabacillus herbersteinensis]|uniref:Thiamine diphosphokinase n=1 Tax=Metabacillus herbersteinensis TaxID=283816 RepID=A0ABV6GC59_9BACI